jgi:SAM-dependent methyltransferase
MGNRAARRELREQNRRSWNAVVPAHNSHRGDLATFLREGGSTLFPEERDLLGGLSGTRLLHLMCNSGQDSLSLARLGATVTGVDISDEAIALARRLSAESGIPVSFCRSDVYDWLTVTAAGAERFDIVYSAYGTVCWLSDLEAWARGIATILRTGGRLVLLDFHPAAMMLDQDWRLAHDYYSGGEALLANGIDDYVGASEGGLTPAGFVEGVRGFRNSEPCHLFLWGLGEIVTALAEAGLIVIALHEYPYANGERLFPNMRELHGRRMAPPVGIPSVPLMYGIAARKPGSP